MNEMIINGIVEDSQDISGEIRYAKGTTGTYKDLSDKPMINGVELSGDQSAEELNLQRKLDDNAIMHRNIFRGRKLGTSVTTAQKTAIQNGTFEDLYIGDYWLIDNTKWVIADMDYWYNTGNVPFTSHHLVVVPDQIMYKAQMHYSSTFSGGYANSDMRKWNLATARQAYTSAFGDSVLTHKEFFINNLTDGYATAGAWYDSTADLMSEIMLYGCTIRGQVNSNSSIVTITNSKTQLALFRLNPLACNNGQQYWLRNETTTGVFAVTAPEGYAVSNTANMSYGVRPVCAIG